MFYNQFNINQNILTIRFPCWQDFILDVFFTITEHMYGKIFQTLIIFAQFRWIYAATASIWAFSLGSAVNSRQLPLPTEPVLPCSSTRGSHPLHWVSQTHGIVFLPCPRIFEGSPLPKDYMASRKWFLSIPFPSTCLPIRYPHTLPHSHLKNQTPTLAIHSTANSTCFDSVLITIVQRIPLVGKSP